MGTTPLIWAELGQVFAECALSFHLQVSCHFHQDFLNFMLSCCVDVPFSRFNHQHSSQLVMVEPKLIIELQQGDVMMFPSSLIMHRNTPPHRKNWLLVNFKAGTLLAPLNYLASVIVGMATPMDPNLTAIDSLSSWQLL